MREIGAATGGQGERGLRARLEMARHRSFVGREAELRRFRQALSTDPPDVAVLYVHGPGGVGKSALVRAFAVEADRLDRPLLRLDGRVVDASPAGFLTATAGATGVDAEAALDELRARPGLVLLVDTYEELAPIDRWLRGTFLPELPRGALVVLAGREPPATGWRTDDGWRDLVEVLRLQGLGPAESGAFLAGRGVDPARHGDLVELTRGHPLALVLVTEVLAQRPDDRPVVLDDVPTVVEGLLRCFLHEVPSEAHRQALYAAAQIGTVTEGLLRHGVPSAPARELFDWLSRRSFTRPTDSGLALHELVADALNAELRWRDPEGFVEMHDRVAGHVLRRVTEATGPRERRAMLDLLRLYRLNPVTRRFFVHGEQAGQLWTEPARGEDHDAILDLIDRHEGAASARVAAYWLDRQPEAFTVFRGPAGDEAMGFVCHLRLGDTPGPETELDPVLAAVWRHVRAEGPLRSGERLRVMRFWVGGPTYQGIETHHLTSATCSLDWVKTAGLAWAVVVLADPGAYEPIFRLIGFQRPEIEVRVGQRSYGMFVRDFRATSRRAWFERLREVRLGADGAPPSVVGQRRLRVMDRDAFADAVREALRGFARPGGIDGNPLLETRVVAEGDGGTAPEDRLTAMLERAAAELSDHPLDRKAQRALELTYFRPAPTQEAAAQRLDLPFSTFRRHLARGVDHVTEWLWQRELRGGPGS